MRTIEINGTNFSIYAASEAGCPEAHQPGKYYFQPVDYDTATVYSEAFDTESEAIAAIYEAVRRYPDLFDEQQGVESCQAQGAIKLIAIRERANSQGRWDVETHLIEKEFSNRAEAQAFINAGGDPAYPTAAGWEYESQAEPEAYPD